MKTTIRAFSVLLTVAMVEPLPAADRVALLIGCGKYRDLVPLGTPVNDANALKTVLEGPTLGFECLPVVADANLERFYEALDSFQAKARNARVALIFYSGHGIEHDGENYLIPVNAELGTATQLKTQALNVTAVMTSLAKTQATAKVAILDCCRDNPFRVTKSWAATKSVRDEVLAQLGDAEIPQSTLVCFATSAGRKAASVLNDSSVNSPFTQFLLKEIQIPGQSLRDVFEHVHDNMETATEGRQVPAVKTDNALSKVFRQMVLVEGTTSVPPATQVAKMTLPRLPTLADQPKAATPASASKELPFENMLGMKFVPVPGTDVLFCVHETRVRDYAEFAKTRVDGDSSWRNAQHQSGQNSYIAVSEGSQFPVVNVCWDDAQSFCKWLSTKEKRKYRLPTDQEWSFAVGIGESEIRGASPESKSMSVDNVYPWGTWPPGKDVGNYYDNTAFHALYVNGAVESYTDGHITTAPVMSFEPNIFGIFDLGGNVAEWCEDKYNTRESWRVLRGASWFDGDKKRLLSSYRQGRSPSSRYILEGFRCVLAVDNNR